MDHPRPADPSSRILRIVAVIGNPNTGKSTLFTRLTGLSQKVGNYPGVTVEKREGRTVIDGTPISMVDLPGTYSLAANSPDEMVTVDVLLGTLPGAIRPDAVLLVADATNLRRNLYLASQVLELGQPVVLALNMTDVARKLGIEIDHRRLSKRLGVPVVPVIGIGSEGYAELGHALATAVRSEPDRPPTPRPHVWPELAATAVALTETCGCGLTPYEIERALVDVGSVAEERAIARGGEDIAATLRAAREQLGGDNTIAAEDACRRYAWIASLLAGVETRADRTDRWTDRLDAVLLHPVIGSAIFILLMALVFQAIFAGAAPLMELIDAGVGALGDGVAGFTLLGDGALKSFLVDGVIAGVGGVIIFLPQILVLFFFIGILEDSGYMARTALLSNRLMKAIGLSGQSFVPMLSSFACAVPGIMAARTIPDRRVRVTTILVAPLMSCSARLPVYTIMIKAFVPDERYLGGWIGLQGIVLLGMYLLGIVVAVPVAFLLRRVVFRGPKPAFMMEMPGYKRPRGRIVLTRMWERGVVFLKQAGTVIFVAALVVWALSYFPRPSEISEQHDALRAAAEVDLAGDALAERLDAIDKQEAAAYLEASCFGQLGHAVEPVFEPLGWDWRIALATIASFPAREIVVATLGTTFSLGGEVDDEGEGMIHALKTAQWPDGRTLFTLPVALGLMVFFALCAQCAATLAAIKRELNSWFWPIFSWTYMTVLAYLGALLTYQVGTALGG